jgi:hypothetical protein
VRACGKQQLRLQVRLLDCRRAGLHVVVSTTLSGAACQLGRSWPASFARDLDAAFSGEAGRVAEAGSRSTAASPARSP